MKTCHVLALAAMAAASLASAQTSAPAPAPQQRQQDLKGMEKSGQRDDVAPMTAAQQAQYKRDYETAKAKWASMTPDQKKATVESARSKKLSDLDAVELVGQRDDMRREGAAHGAQLKSEADAAKAKWDRLSPADKQAVRKSAWTKKRGDLDALEAVGQRDDSYVLPY